MAKKKKVPEIEAIIIIDDGQQIIIPWDKVGVSAYSSPCELCGEHGEIELSLPDYPTFTVYDW